MKVLQEFDKRLIDENSKDVKLENHELGPRSEAADLESRKVDKDLDKKVDRDTEVTSKDSGAPTSSRSKPKERGRIVNTGKISQNIEFGCSTDQLFEILTKQELIRQWTRGAIRMVPETGQMFMFGDNVETMTVEQERPTKLVWLWRNSSWPKDHYSTVTIQMTPNAATTKLSLKQEGLPVGEEESTKENWNRYYWQMIKSLFG